MKKVFDSPELKELDMPTPATAISIELLDYLRTLYQLAIKEFVCEKDYSGGINGFTDHTIPAFIIAVAAVESFTNEMLLGRMGRSFKAPRSEKSQGFWDALERASLKQKLLFAPEFHFGETFDDGAQPYQDMNSLINVRNDLVHYKMESGIPSRVKDLEQRGIAIRISDSGWAKWIQTTEGIRWAHKTACETMREIIGFADHRSHPILVQYGLLCGHLLEPITEIAARRFVERILASKNEICG